MFPDLANLDRQVVGFMLTFFRVGGLMLMAPLFGSGRVPRRLKLMMALVMSIAMLGSLNVTEWVLPQNLGQMVVGMVGEILFGITLGMVVSLVFIAAQWAGSMISQQIGLSMSEVFDPQFAGGSSILGDLYFMLTTAAFLILGGHRQLVIGTHESLIALPPMSLLLDQALFETLLMALSSATVLAMRLAAPMFVTMIIVDVAMGCISKTVPQLNVMSAGMALRGIVGVVVMYLGVPIAAGVIATDLDSAILIVRRLFGGN
jgi:flagellar biosynthesis protein FliR